MKKFIKKHKALFVIICVLFVAIAALSVYFIFFNKKEEAKAKEEKPVIEKKLKITILQENIILVCKMLILFMR